ncbi:hypothetical protein R3P38DRAFT_2811351 [Favolaschia claudopus]|uniref:Uncharacterized protein n=1 Tax=Favolaschia claudopus TaxID=2862362 RepID=A0AAV9Z992_9AGAR
MPAPDPDSNTVDTPPPLELIASPSRTFIDSESICRAWAESNPLPPNCRQMGAGGRRHSLLDDTLDGYYLYHQYRALHRLQNARGPQIMRSLRLSTDSLFQRLLSPLRATSSAQRKRNFDGVEAVDEEPSYPRRQTKRLKSK